MVEPTRILHNDDDVNREMMALSNYLLFQRGFKDTGEVISFIAVYLVKTLAIAVASESAGKVSKEKVVEETAKFLRELYNDSNVEKLIADVYEEVQNWYR